MLDLENVLPIVVEFTGGLETLSTKACRKNSISLPQHDDIGQKANMTFLIHYLCTHFIKADRKEGFLQEGTVRPGILVIINDADWELEGGGSYEIQKADQIVFVSTLHGG
ncbi:Ubiquitin- modifier 1 [Toensbergia leucococca]|nr:Ubiquitin- modifier 1 [Toensbergia leucococca]